MGLMCDFSRCSALMKLAPNTAAAESLRRILAPRHMGTNCWKNGVQLTMICSLSRTEDCVG